MGDTLMIETGTTALPSTAVVVPSDPMREMILRAGSDPNFDIEKFERLVEVADRVRERDLEREAEVAFNAGMAVVQAQMTRIAQDAKNSQTNSRYATYGALDRALRPLYSAAGFALSYNTEDSPAADHVRVVCLVTHTAPSAKRSHTRKYRVDMPADGKGAKGGDVMTKTHAAGSAFSYGQRYLLRMIFNIAVGNDDDGNRAGGGAAQAIDPESLKRIEALIAETKTPIEQVLTYFDVGSLSELNAKQAKESEDILRGIKRKVEAKNAK